MVLLYLLLPDWLNTRKEGEKSLSDMQGNVNLRGQPIIESLLHLSFKVKIRRQNHNSFHKV